MIGPREKAWIECWWRWDSAQVYAAGQVCSWGEGLRRGTQRGGLAIGDGGTAGRSVVRGVAFGFATGTEGAEIRFRGTGFICIQIFRQE